MKNCCLILLLLTCFNATIYSQTTTLHAAFEVTVTGQGEPLFLIPGATCSGEVWETTVEQYSKQYR